MNKTPISLDSLIEKMKERGCTSAQLKSNTIPTVLSIIAESDGEYTDLIAIREEINKLKKEKQELDMQVGKRSEELQKLYKTYKVKVVLTYNSSHNKYYDDGVKLISFNDANGEIVFNVITTLLMVISVIATIFSGYNYLKNGKDLLKDN